MRLIVAILFVFSNLSVLAQDPKMDRLEMFFDQGHYKKVYRKANRLLDKPEYDYSMLPKYYKGLSLLQLTRNTYWRQRHTNALDEAEELLVEVKNSSDGAGIFEAHAYELSWVKWELISFASDLKRTHEKGSFAKVQRILSEIFGEVVTEPENEIEDVDTIPEIANEGDMNTREEVVFIAKKQLGVPYLWAGSSPEGFDCSGFTSYVFQQKGIELPRRSSDQFELSKHIKQKDAKPGDLVFFNSGSGVSHVGIVISKKGEPLEMIHSSSSKGIIITDVANSTYWQQRIHGFGTFIK